MDEFDEFAMQGVDPNYMYLLKMAKEHEAIEKENAPKLEKKGYGTEIPNEVIEAETRESSDDPSLLSSFTAGHFKAPQWQRNIADVMLRSMVGPYDWAGPVSGFIEEQFGGDDPGTLTYTARTLPYTLPGIAAAFTVADADWTNIIDKAKSGDYADAVGRFLETGMPGILDITGGNVFKKPVRAALTGIAQSLPAGFLMSKSNKVLENAE